MNEQSIPVDLRRASSGGTPRRAPLLLLAVAIAVGAIVAVVVVDGRALPAAGPGTTSDDPIAGATVDRPAVEREVVPPFAYALPVDAIAYYAIDLGAGGISGLSDGRWISRKIVEAERKRLARIALLYSQGTWAMAGQAARAGMGITEGDATLIADAVEQLRVGAVFVQPPASDGVLDWLAGAVAIQTKRYTAVLRFESGFDIDGLVAAFGPMLTPFGTLRRLQLDGDDAGAGAVLVFTNSIGVRYDQTIRRLEGQDAPSPDETRLVEPLRLRAAEDTPASWSVTFGDPDAPAETGLLGLVDLFARRVLLRDGVFDLRAAVHEAWSALAAQGEVGSWTGPMRTVGRYTPALLPQQATEGDADNRDASLPPALASSLVERMVAVDTDRLDHVPGSAELVVALGIDPTAEAWREFARRVVRDEGARTLLVRALGGGSGQIVASRFRGEWAVPGREALSTTLWDDKPANPAIHLVQIAADDPEALLGDLRAHVVDELGWAEGDLVSLPGDQPGFVAPEPAPGSIMVAAEADHVALVLSEEGVRGLAAWYVAARAEVARGERFDWRSVAVIAEGAVEGQDVAIVAARPRLVADSWTRAHSRPQLEELFVPETWIAGALTRTADGIVLSRINVGIGEALAMARDLYLYLVVDARWIPAKSAAAEIARVVNDTVLAAHEGAIPDMIFDLATLIEFAPEVGEIVDSATPFGRDQFRFDVRDAGSGDYLITVVGSTGVHGGPYSLDSDGNAMYEYRPE